MKYVQCHVFVVVFFQACINIIISSMIIMHCHAGKVKVSKSMTQLAGMRMKVVHIRLLFK